MNYDLKISQLEDKISRLEQLLSGKGKIVCHGKEFHVDSTIKLSEVIRRADRFIEGDNVVINSSNDISIEGNNVNVSGNEINISSLNDGDININTNGSGNVFINGVNVKNPEVDSISFNLQPEIVPVGEGVVSYNEADRALELQVGNDVTLSINEELPIDLLNKLGSQINNGKLVYINGAQGNRATAGYASNATCATASKTIAMATENIANNQRGKCTTIGRVKGLNTQGIAEGSELWLGTNGDWTVTKPSAGTPRVRIGWVLKEHVSDGWIFVYIQQDKYMFGDRDNGNYSVFEDDGTLVFNGDARVHEDLNFDVTSSGGNPAFVPDSVTINNVSYREFTNLNNQSCGGVKEVFHAAYLGAQTYIPHVHIFLKSGESSGTTGVTFTLYWELRQGTSTTNGSVTVSATSAQLAANGNKINLYAATGFTGPTEIGAQLAMRLERTNGDAGDVVATTYGVHVGLDMVGSRTETSK